MNQRPVTPSRSQLLQLAVVFQGGLFLLGLLIAWGTGLDWGERIRWDVPAVLKGFAATIPLTLFLWLSLYVPWTPLAKIREFLLGYLGPMLRKCSAFDLLLIALLAGITEEILFRGAIQNWASRWGLAAAVVITNVAFGVCHAISAAYFVLAALAGFYLSWVAGFDSQNLVPAIIAHAAYDFIALVVVARQAADPEAESDVPPEIPDDASDR